MSTLVIADCGSTKSDWRIIRDGAENVSVSLPGINPALQDRDSILERLSLLKGAVGADEDAHVYYYGAGTVSENAKASVQECLGEIFPGAGCEIESDMTGAVRALFGDGEGIAAIIGTGANSAFCRGGRPVLSVPSGGFILGDEGSGAWIGRMLLSDYIKSLMPEDIREEFSSVCPLDYAGIVDAVYSSGAPNGFLASFAPFARKFKEHPYVDNLLKEGFELFFTRNLMQYGCLRCFPVRMTGSVAYYFSDKIGEVAAAHGATVDMVRISPMEGLVKYHSQKYGIGNV